jgi:hypothetical protein
MKNKSTNSIMKKAICSALIICLLFAAACKKSPPYVGNWTFMGTTYSGISAIGPPGSDPNTLALINGSASSPSNLTFVFAKYPTSGSGLSYNIVSSTADSLSNDMYMTIVTASGTYRSTGSDHATATVSVSSSGKVSITCASVEVLNIAAGSTDSAAVTNIVANQQQ